MCAGAATIVGCVMTISVDTEERPLFLSGGGKLGALIRAYDWRLTPLGAPETWPHPLRAAMSICLNSSFPTAIYWGSDLRLLYNDAWAPIPGERHPAALGRPGADVWSDIWDIVGPQLERVMLGGEGVSAFDHMLPIERNGVPTETYWNYSFTPILDDDGVVMGVFNQGHETTAAVMARRSAEAEVERLGRMFAQAPGAVAVLRGPTHIFDIVNPAYEALVGRTGLIGKTVAEALPEVVAQGFITLLDNVYANGQPYLGQTVPVNLARWNGEHEERFIDFVYQPLSDSAGCRTGIFVQASDVTEQRRAEEGRQLLVRELNHRVKNLFAVASGMVSMTARSATSVDQMANVLRGRLGSLAKAHELIRSAIRTEVTDQNEGALLDSLVREIVRPHIDPVFPDQFEIEGKPFALGVKATTAMALILHELATNAAKYGALCEPGGQLKVSWTILEDRLIVDWRELTAFAMHDGVVQEGFGSKLARATATGQLGGMIAYDWRKDGVRIMIELPLARLNG